MSQEAGYNKYTYIYEIYNIHSYISTYVYIHIYIYTDTHTHTHTHIGVQYSNSRKPNTKKILKEVRAGRKPHQ